MDDSLYPTIETDPHELEEIALDYLRSVIPGWEPTGDGDAMTALIQSCARIMAEARDIASDVPAATLRYLGETVHGISPVPAASATVAATVTARDDQGYTLPAGVEVLVRTSGDDGIVFATTEEVVIEPGSTATEAGAVTLRAVEPGSAANGLDASHETVVIRADFGWVERVELVGVSAGGVDAETDDAYIARLVDELELQSPAPILPRDFAILARRVPGVARALATNLTMVQPEVIEIALSGSGRATVRDLASGEQITVEDGDRAAEVAGAFEALAPGDGRRYVASAAGGPLATAPVTVELTGRDAYGPWQVSSSGPAVSATVLQQGGDATEVPRAVAVVVVDADGEPLGATVKAEVRHLLESMREANWIVSVVDPAYTTVDVSFTATCWPDADPAAVEAAAVEAVESYLSPASWGSRRDGEQPDWHDEDTVRLFELVAVLDQVPGLRHVTSLEIGESGGALGTADVPLAGPAGLPRPGDIRGTVIQGS